MHYWRSLTGCKFLCCRTITKVKVSGSLALICIAANGDLRGPIRIQKEPIQNKWHCMFVKVLRGREAVVFNSGMHFAIGVVSVPHWRGRVPSNSRSQLYEIFDAMVKIPRQFEASFLGEGSPEALGEYWKELKQSSWGAKHPVMDFSEVQRRYTVPIVMHSDGVEAYTRQEYGGE
jgi:hypothetical protein